MNSGGLLMLPYIGPAAEVALVVFLAWVALAIAALPILMALCKAASDSEAAAVRYGEEHAREGQ